MGQYVQVVPVKFKTETVTAGTTAYLDTQSYPFPLSVGVVPGASGTVLVEYSITPYAAGLETSATWYPWPAGAASVATMDVVTSPVSALRFTATTAAGTYEVPA